MSPLDCFSETTILLVPSADLWRVLCIFGEPHRFSQVWSWRIKNFNVNYVTYTENIIAHISLHRSESDLRNITEKSDGGVTPWESARHLLKTSAIICEVFVLEVFSAVRRIHRLLGWNCIQQNREKAFMRVSTRSQWVGLGLIFVEGLQNPSGVPGGLSSLYFWYIIQGTSVNCDIDLCVLY